MPEETEHRKPPQEQLDDVISWLKELAHYSRTNIEHLGADWLLVDHGLKFKELAKAMAPLMVRQNQVQDAVVELIETAEGVEVGA